MLKEDIGKSLMVRFKKSKDFDKTTETLQKDGYIVKKRKQRKSNYKEICVYRNERLAKDNLYDFKVIYEENVDIESPYKQNIWGMYY